MTLFQAIIMGLVQGITEFLPISSSGHLVIISQLLHMNSDTGILFEVMLHVGTLIAVFVAFWSDIKRLFIELFRIFIEIFQNIKIFFYNKKKNDAKRYHKILQNNYRKFVVMILISTIPTAIIGLLLHNMVISASKSLLAAGSGLLITAVLLFVVDYNQNGMKIPMDVTYANAVIIGICQGIAAFPGISRSGITITACLLCGFQKKFSVKYSFIMSIPAIIGAAVLELVKAPKADIVWSEGIYGFIGMVIAAGVGFVSIKMMLVLVQKRKFKFFAVYCAVIGIVAITCNFMI